MSPDELRAYNRQRQWEWRARKRAEREAARLERVLARTSPPPIECAWAAGHFEGEGTVTINHGGTWTRRTRVKVSLTNTEPQSVRYFQERWGGSINVEVRRANHHKVAYRWALNGSESVQRFLLDVQPHLQINRARERVKLALEEVQDRVRWARDASITERSEARLKKMRQLNRRGVPCNPPNPPSTN